MNKKRQNNRLRMKSYPSHQGALNSFHPGNQETGALANSEDSDKIRQADEIKQSSVTEMYRNVDQQPLKIQNDLLHAYCSNIYGYRIVYKNE